MRLAPLPALAALALVTLVAAPSSAAQPDNNVEWNGVSHMAWQDRRPVCPVNHETFQVRFQAYRNDLTAARLHVDDGSVTWVAAAKIGTRGPYDLWAAQAPATAANVVAYWLELTDGTDTDYYSLNGMSDGLPADGGFIVNFTTLEHAPVGATRVNGGGTVFKVWAPTRTTAHVRGEFNGWGTGNPMTKLGEHFIAQVAPTSDRQMYKYFFNSLVWNTDPRGRSLDPSQNLNARIEDPFRYAWGDSAFQTPALEDMVIYQLHVGTFAGRNDPYGAAPTPARYVDVAARVSQLVDLGVNTVMLNPITEFPGDLSAGYNPQTMWAPEWKYGTPDELKQMVDTLHRNGIAVLLDIVWNHLTVNDNFLWNYDGSQTWFDTPQVDTPWGAQADFDKAAVRDWYVHSALLWLEEFHVDGFRMDATDYMNIPPQDAAGWALMQRLNDTMDNRWADKVAIAEQLPDDDWVTRPTSLGGAGFDSQYHDAFVDNLRQEIFDAATGDPEMWRIRDIINGGGAYLSGKKVLHYLELHDEAWPSSGGQRIAKSIDTTFPYDDLYAKGRVKLGQGLVLLAPGVPAFLMGAEWLEDTDFGADAANKLDWSKKITYAPIFQYFKDLIRLRRAWPAFKADAAWQVFHINESGNVIAFRRSDASGNPFVVIANFSNANDSGYRLGLPLAGDWTEMLNSQSATYSGNGLTNPGALATQAVAADGYGQSALLTIPQMGLIVLGPSAVVGVAAPPVSPRLELQVTNPVRGRAAIAFTLPRAGETRVEVLDVQGRRVATLQQGLHPAGAHTLSWDSHDAEGRAVAAGVYLVRVDDGTASTAVRVVVLR